MCVLAFGWRVHERFPVVLAGNRDEFHERPTAAAHWWDDAPGLLAGKDLRAGGTWMGVTRSGRFAVITNIREPPVRESTGGPSRGALVREFLLSSLPPARWAEGVRADSYQGFNLIAGDRTEAIYLTSRRSSYRVLEPGIHGLSNHLLNTSWPKVEKSRQAMESCLCEAAPETGKLFLALADRQTAEDDSLPSTGIPEEWERRLSSVFVVHPEYGTRASTVITMSRTGNVCFEERGFDPAGNTGHVRRFGFAVS